MMAAELLLLGFFLIFAAGVVWESFKAIRSGTRWVRAQRAVSRHGQALVKDAENHANG